MTLAHWLIAALAFLAVDHQDEPLPLQMIVMDPLSLPLSCPCVSGYAQRDYTKLAEFLTARLGREVKVEFSDSLIRALKELTDGHADIVIGKDSVIRADAKASKRELLPILSLTDISGSITQTGLVVVLAKDQAQKPEDLEGYRLVLGPADSIEKHEAAIEVFEKAGFKLSGDLEISPACDAGVQLLIEEGEKSKIAAVISSYAKPLLEGCGTIDKGAVRVIAQTKPVPFVTAFLSSSLNPADQAAIRSSLLQVASNPMLKKALESKSGFIPLEKPSSKEQSDGKKNESQQPN